MKKDLSQSFSSRLEQAQEKADGLRKTFFILANKKSEHTRQFDCNYFQCTFKSRNFCSRCKTVRYCSEKCIRLDWKSHQPVCNRIFNKRKEEEEQTAREEEAAKEDGGAAGSSEESKLKKNENRTHKENNTVAMDQSDCMLPGENTQKRSSEDKALQGLIEIAEEMSVEPRNESHKTKNSEKGEPSKY